MSDIQNGYPGQDMTKEFIGSAMEMIKASSQISKDRQITVENVYQPAFTLNREPLLKMMNYSHLPGSRIIGAENVKKLYELAQQGKSVIIMSEHLSNLDVPNMYARFYHEADPIYKEIFEKFIFVAGAKLNENDVIKVFAEMFTRVVIIPPLTTKKWEKEPEKFSEELNLAKKINLRAIRKIIELKNKGNIFVMFPAGTRYRPWMPETKKGLKETMAYMSHFDYFCCCSINGNNMAPNESEDMAHEKVTREKIVLSFGEVIDAKKFSEEMIKQHNLSEDQKDEAKQVMVDEIMKKIQILHDSAD
ncbi:MAG: 1-acyl-sn-glycerol-3-phosphate acyltransferase [Spirochaetales bacterium]|nr:1-acyl-sn-glycerol-3-phosphate acyltransferase [Spirochaetales bacterium]